MATLPINFLCLFFHLVLYLVISFFHFYLLPPIQSLPSTIVVTIFLPLFLSFFLSLSLFLSFFLSFSLSFPLSFFLSLYLFLSLFLFFFIFLSLSNIPPVSLPVRICINLHNIQSCRPYQRSLINP